MKFCEDGELGISLVKYGKNLRVHKKRTVGVTDKVRDFFDHKNSSVEWLSKRVEERAISSPQDKRKVWVVKGSEKNPEGIRFHIQVDPEEGKIVFRSKSY